MTLRRKLILLLAAFAVFVVGVTGATIYAIHLYINDATQRFERWTTEASRTDRLLTTLNEYVAALQDRLTSAGAEARLAASQSVLLEQLESTSVPEAAGDPRPREDLRALGRRLREETREYLTLIASDGPEAARRYLDDRINAQTVPLVRRELMRTRPQLEAWRQESAMQLVRTGERVLLLAAAVAVTAAVMLLLGAHLIGRWLILPIADLHEATAQFRAGRLDYRVRPRSGDELGQLATALNTMAGSLAEADRVLQASERKYRALFENLRDALVICDADGRVVECHDSDTSLLMTDAATARGRALNEAFPGWASGDLNAERLVRDVTRDGIRRRRSDVVLLRREDGVPCAVDVVAFPIEMGGRRCAALVLRDARERRALEERVRRAETMEALGRFAGGIAHDFNNLLTGAVASLGLMQARDEPNKQTERLNAALAACWQAAGLSRRLLHLARGGRGHAQALRPAELVETILSSQDEAFFSGVSIEKRLDPAVAVRMDPDELTQVILNLIMNAKEAMPDGGRLTVVVDRELEVDEAGGDIRDWACIRVRDSGAGIAPEARRRIFEPFYTTKHRAGRRGTGLGLSIVYAAVASAGGRIDVESEPGEGAAFMIRLPPCQEQPSRTTPRRPGRFDFRPGGPALVVDDDAEVRGACVDALQSWGFKVRTAASIAEARQCFADASADRPTLALIDAALPDGAGADLAEAWLREDPGLAIIMMSGYARPPDAGMLTGHLAAWLEKPFPLEALAAALDQCRRGTADAES
ncbi:MAG: Sensor histidine kinase RcsC [Phycisphaerae bacterium]|nr:Sensor histidine kinase RcsC [Phycisphaerae bacterium]